MRAEYATINILIALLLNMMIVYAVLRLTSRIERLLGPTWLHILKKFFGIILIAIAIRLFVNNTGISSRNESVRSNDLHRRRLQRQSRSGRIWSGAHGGFAP